MNRTRDEFELDDDQLFEALVNLIADHGCASNDDDIKLVRSLTDDLLLAHHTAIARETELPMGFSKWMKHGNKYGYYDLALVSALGDHETKLDK